MKKFDLSGSFRGFAAVMLTTGLFLAIYMIIFEGEPGALPLFMILTGIALFLVKPAVTRIQTVKNRVSRTPSEVSSIYRSAAKLGLVTGGLLLIPLAAMLFTDGVSWTLSDFIIAGFLLFSTGLAYRIITWRSQTPLFRIATGVALFTGFSLIWINLAVGIIGPENNPINLLYLSVILTGIIGGLVSRFRPAGLAVSMFSAAGVQGLIIIFALAAGSHESTYSSVYEILAVNGLFISLFVLSAILFLKSGTASIASDLA